MPTLGLSDEEQAAMTAMQEADTKPAAVPDEPETSQEAAEEVIAETEGDEAEAKTAGTRRPKTVPHEALHEERELRKKAEAETKKEREDRIALKASFEERFRIYQDAMRPQQAPAQAQQQAPRRPDGPMPNVDDDPIGAIKWMTAQGQAVDYERQVQGQQYQQQQAHADQARKFYEHAAQRLVGEAESRPEIKAAYEHVRETRRREMEARGVPKEQALSRLDEEDYQTAVEAYHRNIKIGDAYVSIANALGWTAAPAAPGAADKIATATEAQARGKSLSQVGGSAAVTEMTVDRLLSMSNDDFQVWKGKHPKSFDKIMGSVN